MPPRASEATTEWSFSKAKGKSPLLEKFPKSPLFADENSDSSIEDLVAFARNGAASTSTSTVNAKPVDKGKGPGNAVNDDVLAAIAVAHGITSKSAVSASKLAENDSERANYLARMRSSAVLEDENELNDVESPYTETVLLQEMFNLLVTKKWIVSDAVGAFRARGDSRLNRRPRGERVRARRGRRGRASSSRTKEPSVDRFDSRGGETRGEISCGTGQVVRRGAERRGASPRVQSQMDGESARNESCRNPSSASASTSRAARTRTRSNCVERTGKPF